MNFTEWTEMNLELILMSENDIAEFKKKEYQPTRRKIDEYYKS